MLKIPIIDLKNNPKQALIIIAVASLAALALYFNFLLKPQVAGVSTIFAKMNKINRDVKNAETDIAKIPQLKKDIATYEEKIDHYEKMLPAEQEIPSFLENLSEIAKSSNIKIVGITPVFTEETKDQKSQVYQEIPILISAKCGYHELGRFLGNLESSERFMKVADIEIKANNAAPKRHDVELLILTYTLPESR